MVGMTGFCGMFELCLLIWFYCSLLSPLVLPSGVVWRGVISAQDGANAIRVSAHRLSGSMKIVRDVSARKIS